jgi:DNA-binding winged helix-turn-helix (wHTH) protein/Flp pilus assembly protein TadD
MIALGRWVLDPASRRLVAGQDERRLTPKAAGVLLALAETPQQVWSRDALLDRIWPNVHVGEEVLTHAVAELRRALADDVRDPAYIETVHKSGYRLKCGVRRLPDRGSPDATIAAGAPLPADDGRDETAGFSLGDYVCYLEACERFERGGRRNTETAVALLADVLASAPGFAPAQVGMAKALTWVGAYYGPRGDNLERALDHCAAARRIHPRSADAFAAEGMARAIGGDSERAMEAFRAAVLLQPERGETHYLLGRACFAELNIDLAAPMLERAASLRADDYQSLVLAGKARQMRGETGRARADFALAVSRIEPRLKADPDDLRALCGLARCLIQLDRFAEASDVTARITDASDPMNYYVACTFARAGEAQRALDVLEAVVEHGWRHAAWLARDPDFDSLRCERRFRRIEETIL